MTAWNAHHKIAKQPIFLSVLISGRHVKGILKPIRRRRGEATLEAGHTECAQRIFSFPKRTLWKRFSYTRFATKPYNRDDSYFGPKVNPWRCFLFFFVIRDYIKSQENWAPPRTMTPRPTNENATCHHVFDVVISSKACRVYISQNNGMPHNAGFCCVLTTSDFIYDAYCDDFGPMNFLSNVMIPVFSKWLM